MTKKVLYLIRGIPGSGKSTLANELEQLFLDVHSRAKVSHIEADDYFINKDGDYVFDPQSLPEAHEQCRKRCWTVMAKDYNFVIVSNTFTEEWQIIPYRNMANRFGYTVIELVCLSKFESVHNVPKDTVVQMRRRLGLDLYSRLMAE